MAHQLSIQNGKAEMAYAGEKPWHQLGTQVPGLMKTEKALRLAHLDWNVTKVPVLSSLDLATVPNQFAVIRTDTNHPLGVVGRRYVPINNADAFGFFHIALGEGQGQIETAGALNEGKRVWCMAKMPDVFEPLAGDPVERYLLV